MANPDALFNGQGETLDPLIGTDGMVYLKAAGDPINVPSATDDSAPELVQLAKAATATRSNVNDAASDTLLLAANALRKGMTFKNDSTEILYLAYGTVAASLTSYTVDLAPGGFYEDPFHFAGQVRGIWANNASGAVRVTELT